MMLLLFLTAKAWSFVPAPSRPADTAQDATHKKRTRVFFLFVASTAIPLLSYGIRLSAVATAAADQIA
jgi:hypothetical protein